jgi:hypothetical protein
MSRPQYDKGPVLLEWVQFNNAVRVQDWSGSLIVVPEYLAAAKEWHIELLPGRICRIWNKRRVLNGNVARITTLGPENLASWHAERDDIGGPDEAAAKQPAA